MTLGIAGSEPKRSPSTSHAMDMSVLATTGCPHAEKFSIDHIVPLSMGGLNELSNFQVLCIGCNQRKGQATDRAVDRPVASQRARRTKSGYLIA